MVDINIIKINLNVGGLNTQIKKQTDRVDYKNKPQLHVVYENPL